MNVKRFAILAGLLFAFACASNEDDATESVTEPSSSVYEFLVGSGPLVSEMLGLASQMSGDPVDGWKRRFEAETLAGMGIRQIRVGFSWASVEPADDQWTWDETDVLLETAEEYGLTWDARLAYATDWAAPGGSPSEIDPALFADYAFHVAERYCPEIKRYEIWNEPNFHIFWEPRPDPVHYGNLLKAAAEAVKAACPAAEVLFGGLSSANFPQDLEVGTYPFFASVAQAHPDICAFFDAMAIHPYTVLQFLPPESSMNLFGLSFPDLEGQVDFIRWRLAEAGCSDKPIYFTEMGWPHTYIGLDNQSSYLMRAILLGIARQVTAFYPYTFWDKQGREPETENHFSTRHPRIRRTRCPSRPSTPIERSRMSWEISASPVICRAHSGPLRMVVFSRF